jgi:hypothetical protein
MSSVFLYVGIVAIWAFVLVPRWLRRHHSAPQAGADGAYEPGSPDYADADYENDASEYFDTQAGYAGPVPAGAEADDGYAPEPESAEYSAPPNSPSRRPAPARSAQPLSRSKVLQARRRLLTLLVLLAAAAGACTALKLTSWWACIPPAGMLVMYLLLLREAAIADAEQARRRADMEARRWAAYRQEQEAMSQPDEEPSAEIIDISARVSDQLYDQYADATVRAVGD